MGRKKHFSITKNQSSIQFIKIFTVHFENHMKRINAFCRLVIRTGDTYCYCWLLRINTSLLSTFYAEAETVLFIIPRINILHLTFSIMTIPSQFNKFGKYKLHLITTKFCTPLYAKSVVPSELVRAF